MNIKEQAKTILENFGKYAMQIDWNSEERYLNAIMKGLREIEEKKRSERT